MLVIVLCTLLNILALLVIINNAYKDGKKQGYWLGVADGYMIGRHPLESYKDNSLKDAVKIVDELEAAVVWQKAMIEE